MTGAVGMRVGGVTGNRYELLAPLGSGAFGDAWRALDHDEASVVVVKLLDPATVADDVLREAALHRRLSSHPRVVSMRNVEIGANPASFVVSELVAGGSLADVLCVRRPSIVESQRWLRDVLEALAHAHAMDVLHRDVKTSNALLGADGHAQLTDFGVAEDSVARAAVTPGMYLAIAPPELGATPSTEQSDLWLVGIMGYELLTGTRPDLAKAHAGMLPLAHRAAPEVPIALARAVHQGLAPHPADRPRSAERMLEIIGDVPIRAGWQDLDSTRDPTLVRAWRADAAGGNATVEIRGTTSGLYRASAHASPGSRLRRSRRGPAQSLPAALATARGWLTAVVSGKPL